MAVVESVKRALKKLRLVSGEKLNPEPVNDNTYVGMALDIFGGFAGWASTITIDYYEHMEWNNPEIGANFRTRRHQMLSYGWTVEPASSEDKDKEVAEFVKYVLEHIETEILEESLRSLMYAIRDEFVALQIVPKIYKKGPWAGKAGLFWLKPINRASLNPVLENRRLKEFKIGQQVYPAEQFLIYKHEPNAKNPMGTSLFKALLWYDWFYKNGMKYWSVYLERFGMPIAVVKYGDNLKQDDKDAVKAAVLNMNAGYSISVPKNTDIDLLKAMASGKTGYENYIKHCGDMAAKLMLGQNLATGVSDNATRAQAVIHDKTKSEYSTVDGQGIEGSVNRQVIPLLVHWNFPERDAPKFVIIKDPPEDLDKTAKRVEIALDKGLAVKEDEAYGGFGLTVPQTGDKVVTFQTKVEETPPTPPEGEEQGDDKTEEFAETKVDPDSKKHAQDVDRYKKLYSEPFSKAFDKVPELIIDAIDKASRGQNPDDSVKNKTIKILEDLEVFSESNVSVKKKL